MDGQQQQDPPLTYEDPQAYILYLKTKRVPASQIAMMVQERFGPGKSPEQRQKEAADAQAQGGMASGLGSVAGSLGSAYLMSKLAGGGAAAASGTGVMGGTGGIMGAMQGSGMIAAPGAGAGTTITGTSTLGSVGSVALPVAAALAVASNAWESGMKDIVRGRGTREDWINQGANLTGIGQIANMGLRLMGKRSIGKMVTSGKSEPQQMRDSFRTNLIDTGVADKDYHVTLADGSKFNIGLDGKTKYESADGSKRNAWDADSSNPLSNYAVGLIDPMIRKIYGAGDPKAKIFPEQYTGILVNAAISNAKNEKDVMANIQAMLGKSEMAKQAGVGFTPPPPPRPPKGEVVRVSPGMYMNDKGHVGPAKTVRESLEANYGKRK